MDRKEAVIAIARNLRDLAVYGTPAAASLNSVRSNDFVWPNNGQLRGWFFHIFSGAGAGQSRVIATYSADATLVGFAGSLSPAPSINSLFAIFQRFEKDEYDNALDRILGVAKQSHLEEKVATMALVGTQYEYLVPSGYDWINTIRLVPSGGASDYDADDEVSTRHELPPRLWRIEANPHGSYVIAFIRGKIDMDDLDGEWVRVMGQAQPEVGTSDSSTVPSQLEEFVVAGATMHLCAALMDENRAWRDRFYTWRDRTHALEEYIYRPRRGKKVG